MARKQAVRQTPDQTEEALAEIRALIEVRYEIAKEAYDMQDEQMRGVIDQMVRRLRLSTTGYVNVHINPPRGSIVQAKLDQKYVDFNLLYVATEILKDLALMDIKIGTYKFPPAMCVTCGAEVTQEKPKKRRRG